MVTVKSAMQVGAKLVRKHKKLLMIPLVWELTRAFLLYFGYTLGTAWPLDPRFFLRFVVPASWSSIDQILPLPLISPNFSYLLNNRWQGVEGWFWAGVLAYALFDSFARGWYLIQLKSVFAGKGVKFIESLPSALKYINQFLLLRLINLVILLLFAAFAKYFPAMPQGFWDMCWALVGIALTFVDLVIIFGNITLPSALWKGLGLLNHIGPAAYSFLIWGAVINAIISIPLNYTVGFFPAFLLAIVVYSITGVILSVGLTYIFTSSLLKDDQN